ncbi:unnamed protein product [Peniophora sp. CBMAI 1063]|nr:unnamed protein product [Peniophora sp. CBMAI 1063]
MEIQPRGPFAWRIKGRRRLDASSKADAPRVLAIRHKRTRVLIQWPETYEDLLAASRRAFSSLPKDDAKIYFVTFAELNRKEHWIVKRFTTGNVRVAPEVWGGIRPPLEHGGPGVVREVEVKTQRRPWDMIRTCQRDLREGVEEKAKD